MAAAVHLTDTITVSKDAISCDLMQEVAVLDVNSGVYYGLDGAGCATWNFIQQPRTVSEIIDHLLNRYDVQRDVCEAETLAFLNALAGHGLVIVRHAVSA
jgi:hypothetical protein